VKQKPPEMLSSSYCAIEQGTYPFLSSKKEINNRVMFLRLARTPFQDGLIRNFVTNLHVLFTYAVGRLARKCTRTNFQRGKKKKKSEIASKKDWRRAVPLQISSRSLLCSFSPPSLFFFFLFGMFCDLSDAIHLVAASDISFPSPPSHTHGRQARLPK
jgi:hypothetical protein